MLKEGVNKVNSEITVTVNMELPGENEIGSVRLNSSQIQGTLYARSKEQGDSVKSKGITKKLKKVFTDLHIPSHIRPLLPVICDDLGVLAVPGIVARDKAFDKKGDIIISGTIDDGHGHILKKHAMGNVIGIYRENITFTQNFEENDDYYAISKQVIDKIIAYEDNIIEYWVNHRYDIRHSERYNLENFDDFTSVLDCVVNNMGD
jgi:tRNA(Ile)-lysidine synthetase-like protein